MGYRWSWPAEAKISRGGDSFHGGGVVFFGGEETFLKPLGLIILTENCEIYRPLLHLTPSWRDPSEFHKDSILV